jgi:DnaK suppressor protein
MNTEHFRKKLIAKQLELRQDISRLGEEAREGVGADVEDPIDLVTSAEAKAGAFEESNLRYETLTQVEDALARIDEGVYGKCIDCGRDIEEARLEAVPWARYCLADQEKHDTETHPDEGMTRISP